MPTLRDVTLISATGADATAAHRVLAHCAGLLPFGAVKLLAAEPPAQRRAEIAYVAIPPMDLRGYNRFMLRELHAHVDTAFCLVVQADGFILDPRRWTDAFLDHDYIGAPLPEVVPGREPVALGAHRVGNGGFSLRSRALLQVAAGIDLDALDVALPSEDVVICHYERARFEAAGLRFAPLGLAARFAIEHPVGLPDHSPGRTFGFHGKHWLRLLGGALSLAEAAAP